MCTCSRAHTQTPHNLTAHLFPLFEKKMAGRNPVLPYLQKSVKDEEPSLNSGSSWLAEKSSHRGTKGCVLTTKWRRAGDQQPGLCPHYLVLDHTTSGLSGKGLYGAAKAEPGSEPMASSVGNQNTRAARSLPAPMDELRKPRAAFSSLESISCFLFSISKLQI